MIDIHSTQDKTYSPIKELTGHTDWVRDVRLGTHNPPKVLHSVCGARQDGQDMDK